MICKFSVILFSVVISLIQASDDESTYIFIETHSNELDIENPNAYKLDVDEDLVNVQLFYESLCPGCRHFDTTAFGPTIEELHSYLNIGVYPYGNAQTRKENGKFVFTCQHGPEECYGNMLHACAIDYLKNQTQAVLYNACMMSLNYSDGSDDVAAKECGNTMNIDSEPIIACAKGDKGKQLLNMFGEISKKANFHYVPYVLINGKQYTQDDVTFKDAVCKSFKSPPPPCK